MNNFLRRFSISHRLNALIALFFIALLTYGFWSMGTLSKYKVNGSVYQSVVMSKDLIADILPPSEYIIESYLVTFQLARSADDSEINQFSTRLKQLKDEFEQRHDFWKTQALRKDMSELILSKTYEPATKFYSIAFNELIPAVTAKNTEQIESVMQKLKVQYDQHLELITKLVATTNDYATKVETEAASNIKTATVVSMIMLISFLLLVIFIALVIVKSILQPLNKAIEAAEIVAQGNLNNTIEADFNDEPGQLLQSLKLMNDNLSSTIYNIRVSAEVVATTAKEIELGNLDLSSRTEEQAGSLETTASTMEELTSTVKQNAENAKLANKLVLSTSSVAVAGGNVVQKVVDNMSLITQSSRKIEDIIGVIDSIAFQTNILALNAAVEAARAGEQGRGFAVVASEVRNLAQRSATAAKEIKELIAESMGTVETGSHLVAEAGVNMNKIVSSIKQVEELMSEIASASSEQSIGIEQVSALLNQMDEVTQQNTALVEESAAASGTMQQEAENLRLEISKFICVNQQQTVRQSHHVKSTNFIKLA